MKKRLAVCAAGGVLSLCAWQVPSWDARLTEPGAVQGMIGETWCGHVQALLQFAEMKDGKIEDITRHCVFRYPLKR